MSAYVNRDAIYKAVGEMTETFRAGESNVYYAGWRIDEMIGNLPAAEVVEVVRCKDCKRCYKHITKRHKQPMWICMRLDLNSFCVRPDDFCSYGKQRKCE